MRVDDVVIRATGRQATQQLARQLGTAIVRTVAQDAGDGANLVTFASQAAFAARFLTDLLSGVAWGCWYYGAFRALREPTTGETVRAVVRAHVSRLGELLGWLRQFGSLESVLALIGDDDVRSLLRDASASERRPSSADAWRPLFEAAWSIADRLGWTTGARPAFGEIGEAFARAHAPPDWRDRSDLTRAVLAALRELVARGDVVMRAAADAGEIEAALRRDFDWIDLGWLAQALASGDAGLTARAVTVPGMGLVSHVTVSSRRAAMASRIADAIRASGVMFSSDLDESRAVLRVLAALGVIDAALARDAAAVDAIEHLVSLGTLAARAGGYEAVRRLALGSGADASTWDRVSDAERVRLQLVLRTLRSFGAAATSIVDALAQRTTTRPASSDAVQRVPMACAGVFLLARAVLDTRLPHLLEDDSLSAWLYAIGSKWAGTADAGLMWWAGGDVFAALDPAEIDTEVGAVLDASDALRLQQALLRVLAAQRVVGSMNVATHRMPWGASEASFAIDVDRAIVPLGITSESAQDLVSMWEAATGRAPAFLAEPDPIAIERVQAGMEALRQPVFASRNVDLTAAVCAFSILRAWARWIPRLSASSVPYLLTQFVRRPGVLHISSDEIVVELAPGGLDIVLEMSGYLTDLNAVPWIGGRRLRFRRRPS